MDADLLRSRLSETFKGDTQPVVARKLNTSQSNVSKWMSGQQVPTTDNLLLISKAYNVSIDWLLGISEEKEIDGVVLDKLSYEQIAKVLDRLFELGSIEMPNINELIDEEILLTYGLGDADEDEVYDFGDEDEENEPRQKEKVPQTPPPRYDTDYIKIKDRILSHMLRRRLKIYEVGADMKYMWETSSLPLYKGQKLLKYSGDMEIAIDSKKWTTFGDADWVSLIKELGKLSAEELAEYIKQIEDKDNDGEKNGGQ